MKKDLSEKIGLFVDRIMFKNCEKYDRMKKTMGK